MEEGASQPSHHEPKGNREHYKTGGGKEGGSDAKNGRENYPKKRAKPPHGKTNQATTGE